MILDSGCSDGVITEGRLKIVESAFLQENLIDRPFERSPCNKYYKIASGSTAKSNESVWIPCQNIGLVRFNVLSGSQCRLTPPLFGWGNLKGRKACIHVDEKRVSFDNTSGNREVIPLRDDLGVPLLSITSTEVETPAYYSAICEHLGQSSEFEGEFAILEDDDGDWEYANFSTMNNWDTKVISRDLINIAAVRKLHCALWHQRADAIKDRFRGAMSKEDFKKFSELVDKVQSECRACQKNMRAAGHPKRGGLRAKHPGEIAVADHFERNSYPG